MASLAAIGADGDDEENERLLEGRMEGDRNRGAETLSDSSSEIARSSRSSSKGRENSSATSSVLDFCENGTQAGNSYHSSDSGNPLISTMTSTDPTATFDGATPPRSRPYRPQTKRPSSVEASLPPSPNRSPQNASTSDTVGAELEMPLLASPARAKTLSTGTIPEGVRGHASSDGREFLTPERFVLRQNEEDPWEMSSKTELLDDRFRARRGVRDESRSDAGEKMATNAESEMESPTRQAGRNETTSAAQSRRISFHPSIMPSNSEDSVDDSDFFADPLLRSVDFLEDEIDGHAYDDLVPLSIRLAVEEQVFGWSHLCSDIVGHVVYTGSWALFTFWMCTWIGLQRQEGNPSFFRNRREPNYEARFGLSFTTFIVLRATLTIMSAVSAFRTVRRRKRVWLRAPYGSTEYKSDQFRRQRSVEETDRLTILGQVRKGASSVGSKVGSRVRNIREARAARKIWKKLRRAEMRFERRHRNGPGQGGGLGIFRRTDHLGDSHDVARTHHQRVRILSLDGNVMGGSSGNLRRRRPRLNLRGSKRDHVIYHRANPLDHQKGVYSHTMPSYSAPQSILRDQISFTSGPIHNIPYAHGGFFGAAPFMLADPLWVNVLRSLMPDVYVEISRRVLSSSVPKLIHWAENNPVVAAYGTAHDMEISGKMTPVEWDVFLDPHLVGRVEIVLEERDRFLRRCRSGYGWGGWNDSHSHVYAEAALPLLSESDKAVLHFYNLEIKRRTSLLVDRMLIAHGNLTQLVLEQTGFAKHYNFSRVKRTRRTLGGGIFARHWLAVYAEALRMGMGFGGEQQANSSEYEEDTDASFSGSSVPTTPVGSSSESEEDPDPIESVPLLSSSSPTYHPEQSSGCDSFEGRKQMAPADTDISFASPCQPEKENYARTLANISGKSDQSKSSRNRRKQRGCYQENDYHYCDGSCQNNKCAAESPTHHTTFNKKLSPVADKGQVPSISKPNQQDKSRARFPTTLSALTLSACPNTSLAESISLLKAITDCNAPIGLVLDIKSRHVSHRIWALVIDALRDAGARVEGIASFTWDEIRDISRFCSSPVKEIFFFHSAGDLQQACHAGQIKEGDSVFFNAGSLLWDKSDGTDTREFCRTLKTKFWDPFDAQKVKRCYSLMPYARILCGAKTNKEDETTDGEWSTTQGSQDVDDSSRSSFESDQLSTPSSAKPMLENRQALKVQGSSTIQDYKDFFQLSIGLYCQEFAVDEAAMDFIVNHVNSNPHVYDLGLSWGGVNGITVRGIQPGRFTHTDGFWNQRYAGNKWDRSLFPFTNEI